MTLCGPWLNVADVTLCDVPDSEGPALARLTRALEVATWLLWAASGRQYSGVCTDTVRPCAQGAAVQSLSYSTGGSRPINVMAGCGCTGDILGCGCTAHPNVRLPGHPIIDVLSVDVGGTALVYGTDYTIVDDRWLVRAGGASWPCCQDLRLGSGQPGTWTVRYRYGQAVPPPLLVAAEYLACQLAASWCTGDGCPECKLPERLTSLTYEGATVAALDPFQFLDQGRFGIPQVDYAVSQVNPDGLRRSARAVTAGGLLAQTHRVRTP
jgi:hypothetical protein